MQAERINQGLDYIKNTDFSSIENGKYEIEGNNVFAIVQDYHSKPLEEGKFEAHKKYIDIQYIIKGQERICVGKLENFQNTTEYDNEKDIIFLKPKESTPSDFITLKEKEFAIFKPEDAHMPSISIDKPSYVKKVVVKVLV